ncbi:tetratricopeptide repeat protein [Planktothrix sp. FACHB-1365]|uniref:CHAT domain-containing protein n=1 Tax=Planktothrix sp. FACHB-1365 TaxID=2692855 RepID=UPI001689EFEA|nr:tetratricopeptide repeat protein [Planktothrix sp. FACHB-1365]MBD2483077.1 tetratricopeptide repeat protein [Planktothrix sp. FACHB-1365]
MLQRIIRFFKQLLQRLLNRQPPPPPPSNPVRPNRSDTEYEGLFLQLLEVVHQGASRGEVKAWLMGNQLKQGEFVAWLERFGQRIADNPTPQEELARRMVLLGNLEIGELGIVAGRIGREILEGISPKSDDNSWLDQGYQQLERENFEDALLCFEKVIELEPDNHKAWCNRGIALADLGRLEKAINSYDKALEIEPDCHAAWYNRGITLYDLGKYEEAINSFDKALEFKPDYHEALCYRGIALGNLGRLEEAINSFDKALEFKPDYHEVWCNRGIALGNLGKYEEEINSYDKALEFKPDYHYALCNRGGALYNLGKYEEAINSYDKALEFKPDYHYAWCSRGIALGNLGRLEEAINSFDKALEFKLDKHEAWYNRGNALDDLGRLEEAIFSYDRALEFKPDDHFAWYNRGNALDDLGRLEEAIFSYDRALEFKPDDHFAWCNRGIAAGISSHPNKFLTSFSQIVAKHPELNQRGYQGEITCYEIGLTYVKKDKQPEGWGLLHYEIGRGHYFEGRRQKVGASDYYVKAIKSYNTALTVLTVNNFLKSYLEVLRDYIKILLELGETERAEELQREATDGLRRLIEETPDNYNKQQLSLKFFGFNQLTVDLAVKSGDFIKGLELAEFGKNTCLPLMLLGCSDDIPKFSYGEMRQFLTAAFGEKTAIIYWHLSPIALTTFILKQDNPELEVIQQPSIQTLNDFEDWLTDWNKSYQEYRDKTPYKDRLSRDWRQNMIPNLRALKEILRIDEIIKKLDSINHVILVPHRDLHYLPLESLFFLDNSAPPPFSLTRLPSLKIGQNLQSTPRINANQTLLNIENPPSIIQAGEGNKKRLEPLPVADIESEFVSLRFDNPTRLSEEETTLEKVSQGLKQNYQVLHFAGHGNYNTNDPKSSMLFLKGSDRLTLEEIIQPDYCLNSYQLVCLAACETAVAGKQTILSEYVGLASGFLMQQVDHVLGTLWVVESLPCSLFVIEFYYRWQVLKLSKTEAFTQTQTWLRTATHQELKDWCEARIAELPPPLPKKLPLGKPFKFNVDHLLARIEQDPPLQHPYYWAAFILSGYDRFRTSNVNGVFCHINSTV